MDIATRFWSKVQRGDGCWVWTAYRNAAGYGVLTVAGKQPLAHRVAWEMANGAIPLDSCVLHNCDNPACVRITHLFLGDRAANNADKVAKGRNVSPLGDFHRQKTHCCHGHEFTLENTYHTRDGRQCRECMRILDRARHQRDREKRLAAMRQYRTRRVA